MLNRQSPIPLYRQIADELRADIAAGRLAAGARLPSEHALARKHGVGRPTVRQATEQLVRSGLLERRRGTGTFVRAERPPLDLLSLGGTLSAFADHKDSEHSLTVKPLICRFEDTHQFGLQGTHRFRDTHDLPAPHELRDTHDPQAPAQRRAWWFQRLSKLAEEPVLLEDFLLDYALFPNLAEHDLEQASLSELVCGHYQLEPVACRQSFHAADAPVPPLTREPEPLLVVDRILDFRGAPAAVIVRMYCRSGVCRFSQTLPTTPNVEYPA